MTAADGRTKNVFAVTRSRAVAGWLVARSRTLTRVAARHWPVVLASVCALAIGAYTLSLPDILTGVHGYSGHGYDDGVYFGAAINLVHGRLPYRSYVIVQPPGIAVLMAPIALIGQLITDRDAFALSRCLTVLVTGANAALIATLLRRRGKTASLIGGLAFAFFPLAVAADHTLMLEPYLVLFCLIGTLCLFDGAHLASTQRLFAAGVLFGAAGTIKLWALFPILAVIVLVATRLRRRLFQVILGAIVGFVVPIAVFFAGAPAAFVHDIFFAQSGRIALSSFGSPLGNSLLDITGFSGLGSYTPSPDVAKIVVIAVIVLVGGTYWLARNQLRDFDRFVLISTVIVAIGMLSTTQFVPHYAYFTSAYLCVLLGTTVGLAVEQIVRATRLPATASWRTLSAWPRGLCFIAAAVIAVVAIHADTAYANSYLALAEDNGATMSAVIPSGSCVVSDQVSYLIDSNRLVAAQSSCPTLLDWYGTWLADDASNLPPTNGPFPESLVATWATLLTRADYVVLFSPNSDAYPRTVDTDTLFAQYRLVYSAPGTYVYCHLNRPGTNATSSTSALAAGLVAQNQGLLTTAVNDYNTALVNKPCDPSALYDLGTIQQAYGNNDSAIALYQEVLAISPTFSLAKINLAYLQGLSG